MKSKTTTAVLALFLGGVGAHKFYLGKWIFGIAYIVFCWTFVPVFVSFIEAIYFFTMSESSFQAKYGSVDVATTSEGIATVETHVRCPDCREFVRKDARKCRHCSCLLVPQ